MQNSPRYSNIFAGSSWPAVVAWSNTSLNPADGYRVRGSKDGAWGAWQSVTGRSYNLRVSPGHTYQAHPVACAAALEVQRIIAEENLLANVQAMGALLERGLMERLGNHRHVGDIRGRGLFWAVEFVQDRASKAAFDPALAVNDRIKQAAFAHGLACYPMGGTIDGKNGEPALKGVEGGTRYMSCVRYNARKTNGQYAGSKDSVITFRSGRLDRIIDNAREQCKDAAYVQFPELERLSR